MRDVARKFQARAILCVFQDVARSGYRWEIVHRSGFRAGQLPEWAEFSLGEGCPKDTGIYVWNGTIEIVDLVPEDVDGDWTDYRFEGRWTRVPSMAIYVPSMAIYMIVNK